MMTMIVKKTCMDKFSVIFISFCLLSVTASSVVMAVTDIDEYLYPQIEGRVISLDFVDADLNDVLKIFSQQSGMNFIASADIANKKINLYLENVGVKAALKHILAANDLMYELEADGNIFVVKEINKPLKNVITRVYRLKYTTVPSSKLNSTLTFGKGSSDSAQGGGDDTKSALGIIAAIEALLTKHGSVVEDARTNSIIVTDIPVQFQVIEATIARLDVRVAQILIEVEMLDISKISADLIGAKFGDTPIEFSGANRDTLFPFNFDNAQDDGTSGATPAYTVGKLTFAGLKFTMQFLRTQTDTKNLARPRILTLNNETAEINIKTDEAIGLSSSTTSSEGTATSVAEAERVLTGVFLKVTPQANVETGEIVMAIEPKVIQARAGGVFNGQQFKDPEERGSKSILRVQDGDTIIIGGLLRTDVTDIKTKVPFLGNIPILGVPFRHKNKVESQRELIIFITPHILKDGAVLVDRSKSRRRTILREQDIP